MSVIKKINKLSQSEFIKVFANILKMLVGLQKMYIAKNPL